MTVTWLLQQSATPVIRITYPILVLYLIGAWLYLRFRWTEVVVVERSTFRMLAVFWNVTMAVRLSVATDPEAEHMRAMAYRDPLTGLSNRRQALDELNLLADSGSEAAVVLLDLDEFKMINDRYGHNVGDEVLTGVADVLRNVDARLASRWGGEEFLLVFDGGPATAAEAAEQVREQLAAATFPDQIRLTASFGAASLAGSASLAEVLRQADDQLYRAKCDGRNLVRVEQR